MSGAEANTKGASSPVDPEEMEDETAGYKPPAEKSLTSILDQDKEDESLERYKARLLGEAVASAGAEGGPIVVFPDDTRQVIVQKLALVVDGIPDKEIDLTQDLKEIKKKVCFQTKFRIFYYVNSFFVLCRNSSSKKVSSSRSGLILSFNVKSSPASSTHRKPPGWA
jgi:hypothetical protein